MQVGDLVIATAGKEKNEIFLVVKVDQQFVYIADGKRVSVTKPKRKNEKHIQKVSKQRFLLGDDITRDVKYNSAVLKLIKVEKERICQKKL